jgi:hypothetical protein
MDQPPAFLRRHPALLYGLITALGAFGIYISMPMFFRPESTLQWIDLAINLLIFVPCTLITVGGGLLTSFSAVFSCRLDENGRFARFALTILRGFGLGGLMLPDFVLLSPLGLLVEVFKRKYEQPAISLASVTRADEDQE